MMLVHWGNTNSKHNHSTTAYWADNWDRIPSDERGNHPCFDPEKDLVLPAWKRPDPGALISKQWSRYSIKLLSCILYLKLLSCILYLPRILRVSATFGIEIE